MGTSGIGMLYNYLLKEKTVMKKYFINPELKFSSMLLLVVNVVFFIFILISLRVYNEDLKDKYIKSVGAIASRIIEKSPEIEKEIMPLVTKEVSNTEALKGEKLLQQYGVSKNLENVLFPNINITLMKTSFTTLLIFLFMCSLLFYLNYKQHELLYEKIRKLTEGAKQVIEGDYNININENREGDISKLAVSFNSMKDIIRNNIGELEKEKQFLADLLSDISHQLKTPISSMIVYNDILMNKELSKEQRDTFLLNTKNQLSRMTWLIQSMLKLAKLDAKAIELSLENQNLNETICEAIDAVESRAEQKKVRINFNPKEEVNFEHDRLWLEEALINIIKNGVEHTEKGGEINIGVHENALYRRLIIEDTGEGISEEDLPHIFKRFFKVKSSRKSDAVGIGLALAKTIIEQHNGIIEVSSRIGQGTKFTITFLKY
jgi:signal transduction histidine kinase